MAIKYPEHRTYKLPNLPIRIGFNIFLLILCSGCFLDFNQTIVPTRSVVEPSSVKAQATLATSIITLPDNLYDALGVMQGICFEAAWDAAGQIFIMRSAEEHIQFYNGADHSQLCRHPVKRYPFDFSTGDVLAGLWNRGTGCTAKHEIMDYQRNDAERTIHIQLQFSTQGDCNYQLVRGFWLAIPNAQDYEISIDWK